MELIHQRQLSENLNTSFHYDHIFGTVINRFMVQASIGKPYWSTVKENKQEHFEYQ